MIFPDNAKPREVVYGTVQTIGARRVQVLVGKRVVIARCEKEIRDSISVGSPVVVAFVGKDQTVGYVLSVATDPFEKNEQGVFTI